MGLGLAGRLSRVLVGWHPRRWRDRYGEEMLDVLDQHQASARTVASLAASVLSTHADPAYRTDRLSLARLRRAAQISAAIAGPIVLVFGLLLGCAAWRERWHLSGAGGVNGMAFAPGQRLLVSAVGGSNEDNMDTVWDIADPARPRQLSAFRGGNPTALSPDGRIVATVAPGFQPALWNVANPRRPARMAVMQSGDGKALWGEAFSPDGQILAVAYTDRIFLWDVASTARPRLLRTLAASVPQVDNGASFSYAVAFTPDGRTLTVVVDRQEANVIPTYSNVSRDTVFTWNVTSSGAFSGLTTAVRDVKDLQPTLAPNGRTVADGSPNSNAVYLWTPP
jgi:WD40 repeat protein